MSRPMPRPAPVTTITLPSRHVEPAIGALLHLSFRGLGPRLGG
jgi:hypothetical protein